MIVNLMEVYEERVLGLSVPLASNNLIISSLTAELESWSR